MKIIDIVQSTPEWHSFRLKGIGASEAPIIENMSPYRTLRELFLEKIGHVAETDKSKEYIFAQGHKTENLIREQFRELTKVEMKPICVIHPEFDYIRASLDGYDSNLGVLEAKLVGKDVLLKAKNGDIPSHHYSQIQHQLECTDADIAQWFGHDGKKDGVLVTIKKDKEYIKRLLDLEHMFWGDVQEGRIPPLSEKDYLIPDDQKLLVELRNAKEFAENAAIQYETLKELVVNTYKHSKIAGGGIKLFRTTRSGTLNLLKVPEIERVVNETKEKLNEEYLETFRTKSSQSWTIRIDE